MNDEELLREFVPRGCQDSFTELARRHLNLVYGTALGRLRDPALAQEVSQKGALRFCGWRQPDRLLAIARRSRRLATPPQHRDRACR